MMVLVDRLITLGSPALPHGLRVHTRLLFGHDLLHLLVEEKLLLALRLGVLKTSTSALILHGHCRLLHLVVANAFGRGGSLHRHHLDRLRLPLGVVVDCFRGRRSHLGLLRLMSIGLLLRDDARELVITVQALEDVVVLLSTPTATLHVAQVAVGHSLP